MKKVRFSLWLVGFFLVIAGYILVPLATAQVKYDPKLGVKKGLEEQIEASQDSNNNLQKTTKDVNTSFLYDTACRIFDCIIDSDTTTSQSQDPYSQGAISSLTSAIGYMYAHPAADTGTYVAYVLQGAGIEIVQPAYAQGLGFASLTPVLSAWRTFRNVAYFFFVVIFLIIGFMIMGRQKIGSQTAVTAQQAIPHIIVSLLFVTFSYAIAGLLIDVMYLVMFFMIGIFGKGPVFVDQNFLGVAKLLLSGNFLGVTYESVSNFISSSLGGQGAADLAGVLGGALAIVIVGVAVLIGVFRLFFELLKTYISILVSITLAPLLLMVGAIPGKNTFGGWVKGLVGNLIAFPTVTLILIIYDELTQGAISSPGAEGVGLEAGGFLPPYLGGNGSADSIRFLIGLGMILIIPDLVIQAKKALGGGSGVFEQLGQAIGESVKRGWGGAELVPGLSFTKIPGAKQITQNAAPIAGAAVTTAAGIPFSAATWRNKGRTQAIERLGDFTRFGGRVAGDLAGSKLFSKDRKKRTDEKDLSLKFEKYYRK